MIRDQRTRSDRCRTERFFSISEQDWNMSERKLRNLGPDQDRVNFRILENWTNLDQDEIFLKTLGPVRTMCDHGPDRASPASPAQPGPKTNFDWVRTSENFQTSYRTRANKILKISNRFGLVEFWIPGDEQNMKNFKIWKITYFFFWSIFLWNSGDWNDRAADQCGY